MSKYLDEVGTQYVINALNNKINAKMDSVTLASVATSGSYTDLSNKPSIPTVTNTYSGTSSNAMSGVAVKTAIESYRGAANGLASLDANGLIPSAQLPSYVDDVIEYSSKSAFPTTGEAGKIYLDTSNNRPYRWSGSTYVEIVGGLTLGETSSTAYAGDKGKANADAIAALATVAKTGSYNDLSNKPTIPSAVTESTVSGWGFTKNTGTYSKPSTGIPKTDLASAVQASLGKADTALQSYTEKYTGTYSKPSGGIPKTDLASAVQTSLGKADTALQSYTEKYTGTYSKPSGGIPKTDLASAVQTSLGKADTAVQAADLTAITTDELAEMLA